MVFSVGTVCDRVADTVSCPSLLCPVCGNQLSPREGARVSVSSYDDCLRRCEWCGIGFSNAVQNPVKIFHSSEAAVPSEVRNGLRAALASSINHTNRRNKEKKFVFETSEDAITWTVFRGLQRERLLRATLHKLGLLGVQHTSVKGGSELL